MALYQLRGLNSSLVRTSVLTQLQFGQKCVSSSKNLRFYFSGSTSPADLHGMWYPTVRRVLVCLSKLYRCIERGIFQGLSQEALSSCVDSLITASNAIQLSKTQIDGQLFLVKHLLILRATGWHAPVFSERNYSFGVFVYFWLFFNWTTTKFNIAGRQLPKTLSSRYTSRYFFIGIFLRVFSLTVIFVWKKR